MSRTPAGAAALALVLALSGCVATQKDVLDLSQQSDDLKTQIAELTKTVSSLHTNVSSLQTNVSSLQANQADLSVQIKQLHEDLTAFSETVKASMGNMDQLSTKLDGMAAQLSGKVAQLGGKMAQLGATLSAAQEKGLETEQKALLSQKAELEAQGRETSATELLLTAEKRLQAHDFAQAAAGLEDYLKKFPAGSLTDVATYDLGLAYFGETQWERAGMQFAIVLEKYPKSGQTPGARLQYAMCLINLKKSLDEARTYLESIEADFPKSPEAKDAAVLLKHLKTSGKPAKK